MVVVLNGTFVVSANSNQSPNVIFVSRELTLNYSIPYVWFVIVSFEKSFMYNPGK